MPRQDAKAHGTAIILYIQAEMRDAELLEERFDDLRCPVECIGETPGIWHVGIAEARIVGSDDVKATCQRRDEISILVRGSGKPMQENQLRRIADTGLAKENIQAFHLDVSRQHCKVSVNSTAFAAMRI